MFGVELPNIEESWLEQKRSAIKQLPMNNLRASSIGNPCDRYHYYSIKNWRDKPLHDETRQSIYDEGNLHENAIITDLRKMGYEVVEQQRSLQIDKPLITGHIDGIIRYNGNDYPFDAKSISPYEFDRINAPEDLMYSRKIYQRNYPAQLQLYLYMTGNEYGCLILKNKLTGRLKSIWMQIDYDFLEPILKRAERVYEAIRNEKEPDRINQFDFCIDCDFRHICLPDIASNSDVVTIDDAELSSLLDRRQQLEAQNKEFEEIDELVKNIVKSSGAGDKVCGSYFIRVEKRTKKIKVPITYEEKESEYLVANISSI